MLFPEALPPAISLMLAYIMQDKSNIKLPSLIQETWGAGGGGGEGTVKHT